MPAPVAAPAAPQQAAVPPFNFGGLGVPAANPAVAAPGIVPGVANPAQQATAAPVSIHGGTAAPHAPLHPFGQGYPHQLPYMSPFMYGGMPYGYGMHPAYGMMPPSFGIPFGHGAPQMHPGQPHAISDPDSIQRQINQLHAQLAVLQATSATLGSVSTHTIPGTSAAQVPLPPNVIQAPPVILPTQPAVVPPDDADDLEDKIPAPQSEPRYSTPEPPTSTPEPAPAPVESMIQPAELTEAERRRAELRQRYSRIYGSSASNEEEKNDQGE